MPKKQRTQERDISFGTRYEGNTWIADAELNIGNDEYTRVGERFTLVKFVDEGDIIDDYFEVQCERPGISAIPYRIVSNYGSLEHPAAASPTTSPGPKTTITNFSLRKFGPKAADHPSIGELCPACRKPFKEGDFTTLIPLGPGDDPEEQAKAAQGLSYNAVAIEVHCACAGLGFVSDLSK